MLEAQIQARLERLRRLANGEELDAETAEANLEREFWLDANQDLETTDLEIIDDVWGQTHYR